MLFALWWRRTGFCGSCSKLELPHLHNPVYADAQMVSELLRAAQTAAHPHDPTPEPKVGYRGVHIGLRDR